MICLASPIVLKYGLMKYLNELLGHPVVDRDCVKLTRWRNFILYSL